MNIWENAVMTAKGLALQSKLIEGHALTITRAVTGIGYVTPGILTNQTAVTSEKQTLTISEVSYPEEGKCALTVCLTNDAVAAGYTATQVGVYALDPDEGEILYFIAQSANSTSGTIIPAASEMPGYSAEWTFYFQYGMADGVIVTVDPANAITREQALKLIKVNAVTVDLTGATVEEDDGTISTVTSARMATVTLLAEKWTGSDTLYSQVVELDDVTEFTKIDLQPSPEQLQELMAYEISLTAVNNDGIVTVYAIGSAPTVDYTMQAILMEVSG